MTFRFIFCVAIFFIGFGLCPSDSYSASRNIIPEGYGYIALESKKLSEKLKLNDFDGVNDVMNHQAQLYCQYHQFNSVVSYSVEAYNTDKFRFSRVYWLSGENYLPVEDFPRTKIDHYSKEKLHSFLTARQYTQVPLETNATHFPHLVFLNLVCSQEAVEEPIWGQGAGVLEEELKSRNVIPHHHELLVMPSEKLAIAMWRRSYVVISDTIWDKAAELCKQLGLGDALTFKLKKSFSEQLSLGKVFQVVSGHLAHSTDQPLWENPAREGVNPSILTANEMELFGYLFRTKSDLESFDISFTHFPHLTFTELYCNLGEKVKMHE